MRTQGQKIYVTTCAQVPYLKLLISMSLGTYKITFFGLSFLTHGGQRFFNLRHPQLINCCIPSHLVLFSKDKLQKYHFVHTIYLLAPLCYHIFLPKLSTIISEYAAQKELHFTILYIYISYIHTYEPTVDASKHYLYILIYYLIFDLLKKQKRKRYHNLFR